MKSFIQFIFTAILATLVINLATDGIFYFPNTFLPSTAIMNGYIEYIMYYKLFYWIISIAFIFLIIGTFFFLKSHRILYILWFIFTFVCITIYKIWFLFENEILIMASYNLWQLFPVVLHIGYSYKLLLKNNYDYKKGFLFHISTPIIWSLIYMLGVFLYQI